MHIQVVLETFLAFAPDSLTYEAPDTVQVGQRVLVPVGKKKVRGIVVEIHCKEQGQSYTLRGVEDVQEMMIPVSLIQTAQQTAEYFFSPLQKTLRLWIPAKIFAGESRPQTSWVFLKKTPEKKMGIKQSAVLDCLQKSQGKQALQTIRETTGASLSTLRGLKDQGIIAEKTEDLLVPPGVSLKLKQLKTLTFDQEQIRKEITKTKKPSLLFGITGSGKTEVYLHLATKVVQQGKQVVLLVPEISLTPQMIQYFETLFGRESLAVLHSRLSDKERRSSWWGIQLGQKKIVIGSRSAIFSPFKNLGLIIIDEEHEWTYKNETTPRYHTRTVAELLATNTGAKLLVGSATPSIEVFWKAQQGMYALHSLKRRVVKDSVLPEVSLCDLREEFLKKNYSIFSYELSSALSEALKKKEQALLFLNKRGMASSVVCRSCGYTEGCSHCDVPMAFHRKHVSDVGKMMCHHCGIMKNPPSVCPQCSSSSIRFLGIGTQRVESELQAAFPSARILRIDADTTTKKDAFFDAYTKMKNHEVDFVVGTQMIAKGLDLPKVSLIGIILADVGINIPDFRASERAFSLLTQVAGRAGRRATKGHVIIQTYNPEHVSILSCKKQDYEAFFEKEKEERQIHKNPPFSRIIKLIFSDPSLDVCLRETEKLQETLIKISQEKKIICDIYGAPAFMPRLRGKYHFHIFVKGDNPQELLRQINIPFTWKIDVDPLQVA